MAGKKKAEEQEQRSLEENFSELEELIEQLEAEDISLEDAFTAYSKGTVSYTHLTLPTT